MATAVLFLCAGATRSSRVGGFPAADEPLDEAGLSKAARASVPARFVGAVVVSPMNAARETAAAMGLSGEIEPMLADADHGQWSGRSFEDVHAAAPADFAAWLADATLAPSGGEAMAAVQARVGAWLDAQAGRDAPVCAITHPTVVRAALAHALALPLRSTLSFDLAPLSRTTLSFNGRWRLQSLNA